MAGVIVGEFDVKTQASMSASPDADEPAAPDNPDRWNTRQTMSGIASNSVTTISSSPNVIRSWPVLFFKPVPPLESSYGFDEWQFVPDSPVFKIPRVPIVCVVS